MVLRLVELAHGRVDADLAEQRLHAEGARLVGDDRRDARAERLVPEKLREQLDEHHGRGLLALVGAFLEARERLVARRREARRARRARGQVAAQRLAPRVKIAQLGAVVAGAEEAQLHDVLVRQRQREAVAKLLQRGVVELLLLVRAHAPLAPVPHAVALLRLGEDHRRAAAVLERRVVGGVDLHRVVPAAVQPVDVGVRQVRDERLQIGILVEEMLAVEASVGRGVGLELAVDRLVQALQEYPVDVAREQGIPVRAPQQLHHVPAGAGEQAFELLHDRAVAAHRAVETLQVAVDDEHQVVETLPRGERQAGERFGLVHLAVADEGPDLAPGGLGDAAILEVAHEARLVDRVDRPQAHRPGRELPEPGHEPGMAVRGKALSAHFLPEAGELRVAQAPFQIRARVHARRRMRLEVHDVASLARAEKMVEADLEQVRRRGIARDVPAELGMRAVRAHHHGERVPAHQRGDARLDLEVARKLRLLGERNGIAVRRVEHRRHRHAARARVLEQLHEQEGGALAPLGLEQRVEGLEPFARLARIGVRRVHPPEG